MVEIKERKNNLEWISKVERTRELCKLTFQNYKRIENHELQDYWEAFKEGEKIIMSISYTNKNMFVKDKNLNEKLLLEFGKQYEKIWKINNFEIIKD